MTSFSPGERPPTEALLDCALRTAFTTRGAPAKDLPPDATFPPERVCRVEAEIARGGMGVVYRARDPALGREVALKLLREDLVPDEGAVRRFLEEARIGGRLQHPGVVPVYALGRTATGRPWFTMKLIEGRTFASMLLARDSPSGDLRRHLAILESVCRTIAYAHDRGVVHLDLKPGNVMVGAFGEVQVVDWGLSALVRSSQPGTKPRGRDGEVYGTPAYMPPEQARGEISKIDERADVFALGAVLCEVLTGAPPYAGGREASRQAAADAEIAGAIERLRSCDTPDLAALCAECLEASPERRRADAGGIAYAIARHFATLEERLRGAEVAAAEARTRAEEERRARKLTLALAGSVFLSILLGMLSWAWLSHRETLRRAGVDARAREAIEEATLLLGQAESATDLALYARASAAADRAQAALAAGEGSPDLVASTTSMRARIREEEAVAARSVERERSNRTLLSRLDALREPDDPRDEVARDRAYAEAFREAGLEPDAAEPEVFAGDVRARRIGVAVAAALDEWVDVREAACLLPGAASLRSLTRLLDPDPARAALREALARGDCGDLSRALEAVDVAELRPGTIHACGRALHACGFGGLERALYTRAQATNGADATIAVELARLAFVFGEPAEGERAYRLAQALRPDHPVAFVELAWELDHLDIDHAAAVELFRRGIELAPEDGVAWFCFGRALRSLGDLDGALAAQRQAARLIPEDGRPHKELAMLHEMAGAREAALEEFERALAIYPSYSSAREEYAKCLSEAGRMEEALAELQEIAVSDELAKSNLRGICAALLLSHGEYERAALELGRTAIVGQKVLLPLVEQDVRLQDFCDLDATQVLIEQDVERTPTDPHARCRLGAVLAAKGWYGAALSEFRMGHQLGSRQQGWEQPSGAWLRRAEILAATDRKLEEALAGGPEPADAEESYAFAMLAARKGLHAASTRWFAVAFERAPEIAARRYARLEAACAAVQTGTAASRARALAWFREDLELCRGRLASGGAAALEAHRALGAWRVARELDAVRGDEAWLQHWEAAAALAASAR